MAELKHGTVTLTLPDDLTPPAQAGKLSDKEVTRIPRTPHGVGLACTQSADALRKAGDRFTAPAGITPESLIAAARRADGIDQVMLDCEVILRTLRQANLLFDAAAYEELRKINDQVKAQAKFAPELAAMFRPLTDFFARGGRPKAEPKGPQESDVTREPAREE